MLLRKAITHRLVRPCAHMMMALLYTSGAMILGLNAVYAQVTIPDTPAGSIDAATRARVIDAAIAKINEFYVFPDVAKKMGLAVRARAKRGEYDAVTDGNAFAKQPFLQLDQCNVRLFINPAA